MARVVIIPVATDEPTAAVPSLVEDCAFAEGLLSETEVEPKPRSGARLNRRRKNLLIGFGATAAVAGVLALAVNASRFLTAQSADASSPIVQLDGGKVACAAEGQNCIASGCCLDGGKNGLQCWAKDKWYAVCAGNETCQQGVHWGETRGTYDSTGTFHLDEWSCEKLGKRSLPGCETFDNETECPESRCEWFRTGKCMSKCEQFYDANSCPKTHCAWDGAKCEVDPCSAPGEDCGSTKCCSAGRGAEGQQCFKKNKWWSACMDYCDANATWTKDWACEKVGERTPLAAPCSWAGKECFTTHCCANVGFSCVIKDDTYTGCVQTAQHSTWADVPIDLPAGWKGTVLGKWNSEHMVPAAAPGAPLAGVSMFCFMAILPKSNEEGLLEVARKNKQSIFACNESAVFNSWKSSAAGWDTGEATLVNTAVFFQVWDLVRKDGRYAKYDWTIKVDADAAFLPDRLRSQLWGIRVPAGAEVYIKNTDADAGMSNGQFLGAIEIFSHRAIVRYFDNSKGCQESMGTNSGEDGFMKGCMDALGVGFMKIGTILKPDYAASYCQHQERVVFHPLKDPAVLQTCYDFVFGRPVDWTHITAPGLAR